MTEQHKPQSRKFIRAIALVGALFVSGQALAHYDYQHPYPSMWQPKSEVKWNDVAVYHNPMIGNYRLDFCYKDGQYCGRAAANLYCRKQGFRYATQFDIERHVGRTVNIATGYVGHSCRDGFHAIRCRN